MPWPLLVLLVALLAPARELAFANGQLARQGPREAAKIEEITKITSRLRLDEAALTSLQDQLARARSAHAECDEVLTSLPECDVEAARRQCEDRVNATKAEGKAALADQKKRCEERLSAQNDNATAQRLMHGEAVQRECDTNTTLLNNKVATLEAKNKSLQEKLDSLTTSSKARSSALRAEIKRLEGLVQTLSAIAAACEARTESPQVSTTEGEEEGLQTTEDTSPATVPTTEATTLSTSTTTTTTSTTETPTTSTTETTTTSTTTENPILQCEEFLKPSGVVQPGPNEKSIIIGKTQYIVGNNNEYGPKVTWAEARDACKSKGMLMLRVVTLQERMLLKPHFPKLGLPAAKHYQYWHGSARLLQGNNHWTDKLWECEPGEPKYGDLCALSSLFAKPAGHTLQAPCREKMNYMCEKIIV